MDDSNKTYFLVPGWDFPADSNVLGSVIANPAQPQLALFKPSPGDATATERGASGSFTKTITTEKRGDEPGGLVGTFLDLFGLGSEDNLQFDRKSVLSYSFKQLRERRIEPSDALMRKSLDTSRVAQLARASGYSAPVYMITGLKTIRGAGVTTTSPSKGTAWRVSLGVEIGSDDDKKDSPPIVVAFELTELRLSAAGEMTLVEYRDGALFRIVGTENTGRDMTERRDVVTQEILDREFGEATFTIMDGIDELNASPCKIIAPSPACVDLLTAGSARIDTSLLRPKP
ncbi:hypothetical protein QBC46DRAFT_375022 [Diplogelasinospora grovesii]|uniref:Uncharacterized protein n=1 Tax=Diplogelasinospora grovesii TaxID=303347 RepID=A0AAN6NFU5_9PEZI|nr:hypothetical protein QBC46DRAFT_375022 [Diplogelasinospora grovesii]